MYFLPLSNQSKEAFIDWARYDDSQDHFCELDGKIFKLFKSVCFIYCLLTTQSIIAALPIAIF